MARGGGPAADFDWDDFRNFIRNYNNVTWRNFNVEDNLPDPSGPPAAYDFLITNAPDRYRRFEFQVRRRLPKDVALWLELPLPLARYFKGIQYLERQEDKEREAIRLLLPRVRTLQFNAVNLPPKARFQCKFLVKGEKSLWRGIHYFGISQLFEQQEVGRVTWALKPKRRPQEKG